MTTITKSSSEQVGYLSQEYTVSEIKNKQKHHHNHHGAHHYASEKKRLRKLIHQFEMMLESQDDDNGDSDDKSLSHHKKMHYLQLKAGIKSIKRQFRLNDHFYDEFVKDDSSSGSGVSVTMAGAGSGNDDNSYDSRKEQGGDHSVNSSSSTSHTTNIVDVDHTLAAEGDIVLSGGIAVLYLFMNLLSDLAQYKYLEMREKAKVSRDAQNMANEVNEIIAEVSKQGDTGSASLPPDVIKYMEDNNVTIDGESIDDYLVNRGGSNSYTLKSDDGKFTIQVFKYNGSWWESEDTADINDHTWMRQTSHVPVINKENGTVDFTYDGQQLYKNHDAVGESLAPKIPAGTHFSGKWTKPNVSNVKLDKGELTAVKSALENTSNRASDFVSQSQLQLQKIMQTYNVTVSLINSMQTLLEEMNKSIAQNIR